MVNKNKEDLNMYLPDGSPIYNSSNTPLTSNMKAIGILIKVLIVIAIFVLVDFLLYLFNAPFWIFPLPR